MTRGTPGSKFAATAEPPPRRACSAPDVRVAGYCLPRRRCVRAGRLVAEVGFNQTSAVIPSRFSRTAD
jgi:hypothetical protein